MKLENKTQSSPNHLSVVDGRQNLTKGKVVSLYTTHNKLVLDLIIEETKKGNDCWDVYAFVSLLKKLSKTGYILKKDATPDQLAKTTGTSYERVRRYIREGLKLNLIRKTKDKGLILVTKKSIQKKNRIKVNFTTKNSLQQVESSIQASVLKKKLKAQEGLKKKSNLLNRSNKNCKTTTLSFNSVADILILSNETGGKHLGYSGSWFSEHKGKFLSEGISFRRDRTELGKKTQSEVDHLNETITNGFVYISRREGQAIWEKTSIATISTTVTEAILKAKVDVIAVILSRRNTDSRFDLTKPAIIPSGYVDLSNDLDYNLSQMSVSRRKAITKHFNYVN